MDRIDIVKELQHLIIEQKVNCLTPFQVQTLLSSKITPQLVLYLTIILQRKLVNPNLILVQAIGNTKINDNLIIIALALRYGANANIYVKKTNKIHIMAYTYDELKNKIELSLIQDIMNLLIIMGANDKLKVYEKDEKAITVKEYLTNNNYKGINNNNLDKLYILLDLIKDNNDKDIKSVIKAHASNLLNVIIDELTDKDQLLKLCVDYLNLSAFEIILNAGIYPDYLIINKILVTINEYKQINDQISIYQLMEMIKLLVYRGITLDQEQYSLINDLLEEYLSLDWLDDKNIIEEIKPLIYSLNINGVVNTETLHNKLSFISKNKLLNTVIYQDQLKYYVANPDLYPKPMLMNNNYKQLNFLDVIQYKDNNLIWMFISNSFEHLLEHKKNPYTSQDFPDSFLDQLKIQRNILKRLGLLTNKYTTSQLLIDYLKNYQIISNKNTDSIVNSIIKISRINGINESQLRSLTQFQQIDILKILNIDANLINLNSTHSFITFLICIYNFIGNNTNLLSYLFYIIKRHLK